MIKFLLNLFYETVKTSSTNQHRIETWYKPQSLRQALPIHPTTHSSTEDEEGDTEDSNSQSNTSSDTIEDSDDQNVEKLQLNEKKLSTRELNKRFMHNFLNTIGKLFTKVGMETYQEVCSRMLHEFNELLRRQAGTFGKMRLLQIIVINLSLVDLINKASNPQNIEMCQTGNVF